MNNNLAIRFAANRVLRKTVTMAFQSDTPRYDAQREQTRKSSQLPQIIDSDSAGRRYPDPEVLQLRRLQSLASRIAFWKRIGR